VVRGIPRFTADDAEKSFGMQWNRFRTTQLDSHTGTNISRERLYDTTGWDWSAIRGKRVLDAGCGAGRFADRRRIGADDDRTCGHRCGGRISRAPCAVQASILDLPFVSGTFITCLPGVRHIRRARVPCAGEQPRLEAPSRWTASASRQNPVCEVLVAAVHAANAASAMMRDRN
jgi:hypothetical protein